MEFAEWLRAERKRRDWTQGDLAKALAVSEILVRKLEAGGRRPSKQVAALLSRLLQMPPDEHVSFEAYARGLQPPATSGGAPWRAALPPHNLPAAATPLIGRERELDDAEQRLTAEPIARMLTILGPPGIGKTRFALALARRAAAGFAEGTCFVPLASLSDAALAPQHIARELARLFKTRLPAGTPAEALAALLKQKRVLLLLDNAEHLIGDDAPLPAALAQWLDDCPGLSVVITSRKPVRIRAEQLWPLATLEVPDLRHLPDSTRLTGYSAVALFLDRARAIDPTFVLDVATARPVAELVARADGLPLAIELVAARLGELSLTQLHAGAMLEVAQHGPRDLPPRQLALRNAIGWSHGLLAPEPRRLFAALSVFRGEFDVAAAAHVIDQPVSTVQAQLDALVAHSLLASPEPARFILLESIREFAAEHMLHDDLRDCWSGRHAQWALKRCREEEPLFLGPQMDAAFARLDRDVDNLRAALYWCQQHDAACGAQMLAAGAFFWLYRGYLHEFERWVRQFLALPGADDHTRARLHMALGQALTDLGRATDALAGFETAATEFARLGDAANESKAINNLAVANFNLGRYVESEQYLLKNQRLCRQLGDPWHIARNLMNLGALHGTLDRVDQARACYSEALAGFETLGDEASIGLCHANLGSCDFADGDYAAAQRRFETALTLQTKVKQTRRVAQCHTLLASALFAQGAHDRALAEARTGLKLHAETGTALGVAEACEAVAAIFANNRRDRDALALWNAAAALRVEIGSPIRPVNARVLQPPVDAARRRHGNRALPELARAEAIALALDGGSG